MTCITDTKSKRRLSAKLAAGLVLSTVLVLGAFVASASAQGRRGEDHRGWEHHGGYNGGYYPAPPVVVYGSPYYYPPPVVYGPGVGLYVPGLSINIR